MIYLPRSIRLKQEGIVIYLAGMNDYHDGHPILDLHGAFGKYEKEEEFARIITTTFNNYVELNDKIAPDYAGLMELYRELKGKKK